MLNKLIPYYSSESTKQLSTFHLPFRGDENVLAKVQVLQPIFVLCCALYTSVYTYYSFNWFFLSALWVWRDIYWKFLFLEHTHDLRQRPILASTPTVRGHAEACPSTTCTKIYLERVSLGGCYFIIIKVFFSGVCGFGKNRSREIWHSRLILSSPKYTIKNDPFFSDLETQP